MSDIEEEWKPTGRPQSTMARSLAAALDNAFMLDSEVDSLTQSVHYKQQMVTIQNRELEALEARIREAEMRLKESSSRSASPEEQASNNNAQNGSDRREGDMAGPFPSGQDAEKRHASSSDANDSTNRGDGPTRDDTKEREKSVDRNS
ncbi:hypothetical protein, variant [Blastomyces dermatitidis ER-3]|uniref:Uncharacterized protein n=2 Tax=Ajellomyces dermatitidis TaxID=5039 RepID=A0A0J9HC81_AJEDA|nr:hypothetical protein, variant [Blastomyces dermatitidis ER-3]EQL38147.1 hypothetical protein, variant [Blastomyces dermatitidis ATCC 26199]KMW66604.1 hypothetical protein, variant [Blastomyces dermatitidis ATCC 18188]OAT00401.1 hypothetical protein, variant [Blastomyces dermatitidis ER-3]